MPPPTRTRRTTVDGRARRHEALRGRLAARLRELRKHHELTREELSEASGVSYDQITKLEDATGGGSLETWSDLAHALGEPIEKLFEAPIGGGAADVGVAYTPGAAAPKSASARKLADLAQIARDLDGSVVEALLLLARRVRRDG